MEILVLAAVVGMVGLAIAFFSTMRKTRKANLSGATLHSDSLSVDGLGFYRPIKSMIADMREEISSTKDPATVAMRGSLNEHLDQVEARVISSLAIRDQLKKATRDSASAKSESERLLAQRETVDSASAKLQITQAYDARLGEIAEYEKAKKIVDRIENDIQLVRANLGSLKAKLTVNSASVQSSTKADELRTALGSLDSLHSSVEEAREFLQVD